MLVVNETRIQSELLLKGRKFEVQSVPGCQENTLVVLRSSGCIKFYGMAIEKEMLDCWIGQSHIRAIRSSQRKVVRHNGSESRS
jgi:hypothetical protein